ncbi:MAG: CRTAC1 family protein [Planctomycetes bacterium]|nr:CRTAC1 family protein [Planctomycetota bacterium]
MNKPKDIPQQIELDEERDDAVIGVALRWSLAAIVLLAVVVGGVAYSLTRDEPPPPVKETQLAPVEVREAPKIEIPPAPFTDITAAAGIDFVHENGAAGEKLLPETMGGGCGWLDFDSDGDQDLLLVNGRRWPWDKRPVEEPATMALYRNDGSGAFENVTAGSGLDVSLYGMGAAVGDYDNDGRADVFLSAVGRNRLFKNLGDGRFADVTETAGVAGGDDAWGTSCGFFDYDNDGDLDLFVCNYVQWSREYDAAQNFQLTGGGRAYGRPQNFEGAFSYLYRNDGETFTDVSKSAGIQVRNPATGVPLGKSLGLTFLDFDRDSWLDVLVANDTVQNFLFHNQRDGTFREIGSLAGVAFDMDGAARGAMGIDAGRFRNDDALGIAIGNFSNEMTALYVAYDGEGQFTDEAISTGLGPETRLELTFGVFFADYDLDGRLDLFAANGHLEEEINRVQPSQHYEQPPQLFWNCGPEHGAEFLPVPPGKCSDEFLRPMVARGAAYADIDNDGDTDALFMAVGGSPRLLRNDQESGHHWLRFKLIGRQCSRDAIGAWVEVKLPDRTLWRQVMPTRSYISQVELPVAFGMGDNDQVESVTVHWPDGSRQTVADVQVDSEQTIEQDASHAQ